MVLEDAPAFEGTMVLELDVRDGTVGRSEVRAEDGVVGGRWKMDESDEEELRWARPMAGGTAGFPTDPLLTERERLDPRAGDVPGLVKNSGGEPIS